MSKKKTKTVVSQGFTKESLKVIGDLKRKFSTLKGQNTKLKNQNGVLQGNLEFVESTKQRMFSANKALREELEIKTNAYQGVLQVLQEAKETHQEELGEKDKIILEKLQDVADGQNEIGTLKGIINECQTDENNLNSTVTVLLDRIKTGNV